MKNYIKIFLALMLVLTLSACNKRVSLGETKTYELSSEYHSLDIKINAADFYIELSDKFSIESNLKDLSIKEENGTLVVVHKIEKSVSYTNAIFKLYIPNDIVFEEVDIESGAGRFTLNSLSAKSIELEFGAGQVNIASINASSSIDIEGGAGEINISSGSLNNLSLKMGVGSLNLTATLNGKSNLEFGVGESNMTLIGSKDDYSFNIKAGIGSISIDGKAYSEFNNNKNAQNEIIIKGGVGALNVSFK